MAGDTVSCIEHQGARNKGGYGVLPKPEYGSRLAHRAALAKKLGRPVDGLALHSCDNPPCINPDHLREGSQAENATDAVERGRLATGPRKDRCVRGHDLTNSTNVQHYVKPNGYPQRRCLECRKEDNAAIAARRKAARAARKAARNG